MASRRIDDLNALDWDDSALIKAYNKGMNLKIKELDEENNSKGKKREPKKSKWRIGDFCRAVYPQDNLEYEAKIVNLNGGTCVINFLGYNEEVEVDIEALSKSHGKQSRRKQMKEAKENSQVSFEESVCSDSNYSDDQNIHQQHGRNMSNFNHTVNTSANYAPVESTLQQSMFPVQNHCASMNSTTALMAPPPPPPMLHNTEMAQNPSLCAMLSSWYMAGYYTGLHQGQKRQCQSRCCHAPQNCCH